MRKLAVISLVLLGTLCSASCNTVKGLGKDVTTIGEKGEELITSDKSTTKPN